MKFLWKFFSFAFALPFAAGAAFAPPAADPTQPPKAVQVNAVADQAAGAVAAAIVPQFSGLIAWAVQEEPVIFALVYGLLHAKKQANQAKTGS